MSTMPRLVLVVGPAGTGKTTLSKQLLQRLPCVYLDNNFFADAIDPVSRSSDAYLQVRSVLYRAMYRMAYENLLVGNNVLIDAPHVKQMRDSSWRAEIEAIVASSGARLKLIACICSEAELKARLTRRGEARDAEKLRSWSDFTRCEPLDFNIPWRHLSVDTQQPIAFDAILDYLSS